jgi:hypothetical protein
MDSNLIWASTLATRTGYALGLLLDLEALIDLIGLHVILQAWSYAWSTCPHHPPLLDEKSSSASMLLESILHNMKTNEVAKIFGIDIVGRKNMTT